jgi:hypothetical protein
MEPRSRGMNGLSTILCRLEVRVIPHTFMLPRHSLSDHVVEALCLHILQLIKTAIKAPGEEKHILPLSPGKRLLLKGTGDLSRLPDISYKKQLIYLSTKYDEILS